MTRHRQRIACLLALAAAPLLAACGADDGADAPAGKRAYAPATPGGTGGAYAAAPAKAASAPAPGRETVVRMAASQFQPAMVTVARGETVRWPNTDPIAHTVTATSGARFDSGAVEAGGAFGWAAERAGRVSYVCAFHPGMTGSITVS
jgi:plastocyanin